MSMPIRIRIARWLAPEVFSSNERRHEMVHDLVVSYRSASNNAERMRVSLQRIVARGQTTSPNSTVKALVKIAQDAIAAEDGPEPVEDSLEETVS